MAEPVPSNENNVLGYYLDSARRMGLPPGGGGGTSGGMEARVKALEDGQKEILSELKGLTKLITDWRLETEKRFGAIESRLSTIDAKLDAKAAKADLSPIESRISDVAGTVRMIPNVWQTLAIMAGLLVGVSGLAFTIAKWAHP